MAGESNNESVTRWIRQSRTGDSVAIRRVYDHYFEKLAVIARPLIGSLSRSRDEEDIALSVLHRALSDIERGAFPDIGDREEMMALLVTITKRKSIDHVKMETAQKRNANQTHDLPAEFSGLSTEPNPAFAAEFVDIYEHLISSIDEDTTREIVIRKLSGSTNEEVAQEVGTSKRTVIRKWNLALKTWKDQYGIEDTSAE